MAYHYRKKLEARKKKVRRIKIILAADGILMAVLVLLLIGMGIRQWIREDGSAAASQNQESSRVEQAAGEGETDAGADESAGSGEDTEASEQAKAGQENSAVTITVSAAGDCTLGTDENFDYESGFTGIYDSVGDPAYFFREVQPIFSQDDLTIVNMEGTLTEAESRAEKEFAFKAPPSYAEILTQGSVEAANLANNHSRDYGEQSYTDTINALDGAGITSFGYERTALMEIKGVKVGLVGTYELAENLGCKEQMTANVQSLKEAGAQIIIVSFHWGVERETAPNEIQIELAHAAIDSGADLVLGHHPHVISGIEEYNGKNIVYSLGNFCFGGNSAPSDMDSMIFQQTFTVENGQLKEDNVTNVIPCKVSSAYLEGYNNYQPVPVEGEAKDAILQRIQEYSQYL